MLIFSSLAAVAENSGTVILVPVSSLDPNNLVSKSGQVPCEDSELFPAIALDLSKLDRVMDRSVKIQHEEWEVNGQRYVRLDGPPTGDKLKPVLNLLETSDGYVALSARGRVEFKVHSLKGSFDGQKVKINVPF